MILHSSIDNEYSEIANDKLTKRVSVVKPNITETDALNRILLAYKSDLFSWQDPLEEAELKREAKNDLATHFPKGQLIYAKAKNKNQVKDNYRLCYKFIIFSKRPFYKKAVYIDAVSGQVFKETDLLIKCNDVATATTVYNGDRQIVTDWKGWPWNRYILIDCANRNIHTKYGTDFNPEERTNKSN